MQPPPKAKRETDSDRRIVVYLPPGNARLFSIIVVAMLRGGKRERMRNMPEEKYPEKESELRIFCVKHTNTLKADTVGQTIIAHAGP